MDPISSSCRNNSRNSNGGVTAEQHNSPEKYAQIAEPLEKLVDQVGEELTIGNISDARGPGLESSTPTTVLNFRSITGLPIAALPIMDLGADRAPRVNH
jgi:hypothetical protein